MRKKLYRRDAEARSKTSSNSENSLITFPIPNWIQPGKFFCSVLPPLRLRASAVESLPPIKADER
jgi:hypothetical protein